MAATSAVHLPLFGTDNIIEYVRYGDRHVTGLVIVQSSIVLYCCVLW